MKQIDKSYREMGKWEKFFLILGGIFFCVILVFVLIHEGFQMDSHSSYPVKKIFTTEQLWIVNLRLGLVGGFLMRPKNHFISASAGIIAALAITWVSFLYFGWRDSMIKAEVVIPLFVGLMPGALAYKLLCKLFKRTL